MLCLLHQLPLLKPLVPSFLQHLFEGTPEDTLPETYGPGEPEEADDEAMDEGIMDITKKKKKKKKKIKKKRQSMALKK